MRDAGGNGLSTPVHRWPVTLAAIAASALGFALSTGLGEHGWLAWIAPAPVLALAIDGRARTAFLAPFLAALLGSLGLTRAYGPLAAVLALQPALVFGLAGLALHRAARRWPAAVAPFAHAACVTAVEFAIATFSPNGTALSLGYSQVDVLPVLQLVALTGLWGVVFIVSLVPAAAAVAWRRRAVTPLLPAVALLGAVVGYGAWRLGSVDAGTGTMVGLAAHDRGVPAIAYTTDPATARAAATGYAERIAGLAERGAQVVVLPEKFVGVVPATGSDVTAALSTAARASGVYVIAGLNRIDPRPPLNVAIVLAADGRSIGEYHKRHLVPGFESVYATGRAPLVFDAAGHRWGVAICKDLDFPPTLREYGRLDVRYLAVPAWDFVADGRMHGRMAVVRGVENGYSVARAAQQGLVTLSDGYGRIVAEGASADDVAVVAELPPGPGPTFYTRTGDWLGALAVVLLATLLLLPRRRAGR